MGSGYLLEGNGVGELLREGIGQGGEKSKTPLRGVLEFYLQAPTVSFFIVKQNFCPLVGRNKPDHK
jgi:hypothetical protein